MAFKAKKLNIDLTLDLSEYIPEDDGGILKTEKVTGNDINEWSKFAIKEGEKIVEIEKKYKENNEDSLPISKIADKSISSIIAQIDYFYGKGEEFYKPIPNTILKDMLEYINEQIAPVKKK